MSKETFKLFVKKHPELAEYSIKNNISFQKFYEIYDMYGEESTVWNKYFKTKNVKETGNDILTKLKNADPKDLQKGITNLQKALSMLDFGETEKETPYEARPIYKYFED